jgi:hypothetical protein
LSLLETGLLNGMTVDAPLHPEDRLVVAHNVPRSILFNRIAGANGYSRMPPLATTVPDLEAAELIAKWISEEVHPYATYAEWRDAEFGNVTNPEGESGANPDGDGIDNFGEWAFGTSPVLVDDSRANPVFLQVKPTEGAFRFSHRRLRMHGTAGLHYEYRSSANLVDWSPVPVTEESSVPDADPAYEIVTVSINPSALSGSSKLFLQLRVQP